MTIKKFKKLASFLSGLLIVISALLVIVLSGTVLFLIFNREGMTISGPSVAFTIIGGRNGVVPNGVKLLTGGLTMIPLMLVNIYIFFEGSRFFKFLAQGETPFSDKNYRLLKKIGLILIIANLVAPLIYSLITSLLMPRGYYINIGIDTTVIIGLIIYCMAEVIQYGITLQNLSDETV